MHNIFKNDVSEKQHSVAADDVILEADEFAPTPILTATDAEEANVFLQILLQEEYDRIKSIFYEICISKDFQYKVLVTRRAYLLYKIFESIFLLCPETRPDSNMEFHIQGEICNSHSLDSISLSKISSEDHCLIFDDIIVHGRAIENTVEKMEKVDIDIMNISIWCLLENQDANCLSDKIKDKIAAYKICDEKTWKGILIFLQILSFVMVAVILPTWIRIF